MLSIGALSSAAQGASYYERDGYYAKDDPEHRDAERLGRKGGGRSSDLKGPVDPEHVSGRSLEGKVPDGSGRQLGRRGKDGEHRRTAPAATSPSRRPSRSPSPRWSAATGASSEAHDRAVAASLAWVERNAAETRMKDPDTGNRMARVGNQKIVAATFRHDTSRNLDPAASYPLP